MATFRGPINLHLGGEEPWATARHDPEAQGYVVEVDGEDADKFRAVADDYGFTEDDSLAGPDADSDTDVDEDADEDDTTDSDDDELEDDEPETKGA